MISVLVPWRAGCPYRERAWEFIQACYTATHPDWELVTGECAEGPFNRAAGILDAAEKASGDVFVVADADVWCDPQPAVERVQEFGWAIPHLMIHRLSEEGTNAVLQGADWRTQPLSQDNSQDSRPYKGHETGTLFVILRDVLFEVTPDRRFVGWGSEDSAHSSALRTLIGPPWRGDDDLVHLWHPAQPRQNRIVGNEASKALLQRYRSARRSPALMRALLDEVAHGEAVPSRQPGNR